MVVHGHGMGDNLESLIERSVMLAVDPLFSAICHFLDFGGIGVALTGSIYFKLNAKPPVALAQEIRFRFVIVVMDRTAAASAMAGIAAGIVCLQLRAYPTGLSGTVLSFLLENYFFFHRFLIPISQ